MSTSSSCSASSTSTASAAGAQMNPENSPVSTGLTASKPREAHSSIRTTLQSGWSAPSSVLQYVGGASGAGIDQSAPKPRLTLSSARSRGSHGGRFGARTSGRSHRTAPWASRPSHVTAWSQDRDITGLAIPAPNGGAKTFATRLLSIIKALTVMDNLTGRPLQISRAPLSTIDGRRSRERLQRRRFGLRQRLWIHRLSRTRCSHLRQGQTECPRDRQL